MSENVEHKDEYVEDCDCCRCAVEFRNRYKAALAAVSVEIGLPQTLGPAPGELKRWLDDGKRAIDMLRTAPRAVSAEADFEAMTWTFLIPPGCGVGPGRYALVWVGPESVTSADEA